MKTKNGKFFVGIGILLIIAGIFLLPDDQIIGIIGILLGVYNVVKGIRLLRGIQPMLIRKQQERYRELDQEVKAKIKTEKKRNE